ncbi:MAG TPA: GGDEF domain-containing protein [Candidatus Gastranaerophilales bacterium]|nr:GGDEF domain-containing protein [Candidatus Gastranaerophilales bacterium]
MKNIIIYNKDKKSKLESQILKGDDYSVQIKLPDEIKNAESLNPDLIILDNPDQVNEDILVRNKICAPLLIVSDKVLDNIMIRAEAYDYILNPIDNSELMVRVANLLKFKELKDQIRMVSTTDELTGLYNRSCLHQRLEEELARAKRYKQPLSAILMDIDFFKVVNDIYGYDWGDVLLKQITEILKRRARKEDVLTRYGDEEFILVLPNTTEENARVFAERIRKDIEEMEFIPEGEEEKHPITISGGIASYPFLIESEENANTIIRYAEHALYAAKNRGKNRIILFSQMNIEI